MILLHQADGVLKCRGVFVAWSGGDDAQVIADNIGEDQGNQGGSLCRHPLSKFASFDIRAVLANRIDLVNVRAAFHQQLVEREFVLHPDCFRSAREERGSSAGNHEKHQDALVFANGIDPVQNHAGVFGVFPAGFGVPGPLDRNRFDIGNADLVPHFRDHQPVVGLQDLFKCLAHRGCRFANPEEKDPIVIAQGILVFPHGEGLSFHADTVLDGLAGISGIHSGQNHFPGQFSVSIFHNVIPAVPR